MFLPQWDFLELLATEAATYAGFTLLRRHEVVGADPRRHGAVAGVVAPAPDGERVEVRAPLTVAADGRHSVVRRELGLRPREFGAPMDVLWFRLPPAAGRRRGCRRAARRRPHPHRHRPRRLLAVRARRAEERPRRPSSRRACPTFRETVARLAPPLRDRVDEIGTWDDVRTLTVQIDRLRRWYADGRAAHRRRGARDVAGRRRRHQPRHPGRGGDRPDAGRAAGRRHGDRRRPAPGAAPPASSRPR